MNCIIIPIQVDVSREYQELLRSIEPENFFDLNTKLSAEGYVNPIHQSFDAYRNNPPVNWALAKLSDLIAVYDYQTEKYLIVKDRYVGKCCWMNKADFTLLAQKGF